MRHRSDEVPGTFSHEGPLLRRILTVNRCMATGFSNCAQDTAAKRIVHENYDIAELQVRHFLGSWAEPDCETEEDFASPVLFSSSFLIPINLQELFKALMPLIQRKISTIVGSTPIWSTLSFTNASISSTLAQTLLVLTRELTGV